MYLHSYFKVDVYSHFFKLTCVTPRGREVINDFTKPYCEWKFIRRGRQWSREIVKVFGARTKDLLEYRYHINQLKDFKKVLADRAIPEDLVTYEIHDHAPGIDAELKLLPNWIARDYQIPILAYLESPEPNSRKMIEIQPGKGKTFLAVKAAVDTGKRIAVILKPGYMDKWVADFKKYCGLKKERIYVVQGLQSLMNLIVMAKEGTADYDVFVISNRTFQLWLKEYEQYGPIGILDQGYDCTPEQFLPLLGVGVRIIDEVHQDFHLNFKLDLYCHCPLTISLSATLISDDPFIAKMYEVGYPRGDRYSGLEYDRYIEAIALLYNVKRPDKIRTVEWGSTMYSQFAFESSVIKYPELLQDYLDMVDYALRENYYKDYKPGNRALIYCGSIDLCTLVKAYIQEKHPDKDVRRYVEDDPYEDLLEPDIAVSTLGSAGTGHDIDLLSTVILTNAVKSSSSNIQGFGRLRNLPGITKRFVYFVCMDIPKHVEYFIAKRDLLAIRALVSTTTNYSHQLG